MKAIDFLQSMGNSTDFNNKSAVKDKKTQDSKPNVSFKDVLNKEINNGKKEETTKTNNETDNKSQINSETTKSVKEIAIELKETLPEEFIAQLEEMGINLEELIQFIGHTVSSNEEQQPVLMTIELLETSLQSFIDLEGQITEDSSSLQPFILTYDENKQVKISMKDKESTVETSSVKAEKSDENINDIKVNNKEIPSELVRETRKQTNHPPLEVSKDNTPTKDVMPLVDGESDDKIQKIPLPNTVTSNINQMEEVQDETQEAVELINKTEIFKNELKTLSSSMDSNNKVADTNKSDSVELNLQSNSNSEQGQENSHKGESKFIIEGAKAQQQAQQTQQIQMAQKFADMLAKYEKTNIRVFNHNGNHHANISLRTAELGNIDIRLSSQKETMSAHFIVSSVATKEMVEFLVEQLRDRLVTQGINVDKITVSHESANSKNFFQDQSNQQFQNKEQKSKQKKVAINALNHFQQSYDRESIQYGTSIYGNTSFEASV